MHKISYIVLLLLLTSLFSCGNNTSREKEVKAMVEKGVKEFDADSVPSAFNSFLRARTMAQQCNLAQEEFESTVYLALLFEKIGRADSAYNLLKTVPFLRIDDSDIPPKERHYSSQYYLRQLALYAFKAELDYKKSYDLYQQCIGLEKLIYPNDTVFVYTDMANQAEVLIHAGKIKEAWEIINYLENTPQLPYEIYKSQLRFVKGLLLFKSGNFDQAYALFMEDQEFCDKYNMRENQITELELLCQIDSMHDNLNSYIAHTKRRQALSEQIQGSETNYQIATLQGQNKLFIEKEANQRQRIVFWLSGSLLICVIISLLGFLYFINKSSKARQLLMASEKERLNSELALKKMEMELIELKMHKKQEQLDKANQDNLALSLQVAEIHDDNKRNPHLIAFEQQIRAIGPKLYQKLSKSFPLLTSNDFRLISLLQVGMSNNEIIALLNISSESLKKNKYRLRKKLGISKEQSFIDFLEDVKNSTD